MSGSCLARHSLASIHISLDLPTDFREILAFLARTQMKKDLTFRIRVELVIDVLADELLNFFLMHISPELLVVIWFQFSAIAFRAFKILKLSELAYRL